MGRYSMTWLHELAQRVAVDLNAQRESWTAREFPAEGPVFGTAGMARVAFVSKVGEAGPEVWFESDATLRLTFEGRGLEISCEWFGSESSDRVLADLLFALCAGTVTSGPRGRLIVPDRAGGGPHKLTL